jgi:hypothetical protein
VVSRFRRMIPMFCDEPVKDPSSLTPVNKRKEDRMLKSISWLFRNSVFLVFTVGFCTGLILPTNGICGRTSLTDLLNQINNEEAERIADDNNLQDQIDNIESAIGQEDGSAGSSGIELFDFDEFGGSAGYIYVKADFGPAALVMVFGPVFKDEVTHVPWLEETIWVSAPTCASSNLGDVLVAGDVAALINISYECRALKYPSGGGVEEDHLCMDRSIIHADVMQANTASLEVSYNFMMFTRSVQVNTRAARVYVKSHWSTAGCYFTCDTICLFILQ